MTKNKQLRARVEEELYERVQLKTDKVSQYVREAVLEKLEKDEYGDQSTTAVEIKQLEVILESKQTIIKQYQDLIDREEKECDKIQAQISEKQKIIDRKASRKENMENNPEVKKAFDDTVIFLLRKKYLGIDGSLDTILTNKTRDLNYSSISDFKEDLKEYVKKEWTIGRRFKIEHEEKDIIQEDINYIVNRF